MLNKQINYEQLKNVLQRLGYTEHASVNHVVFRHPGTTLTVILPRMKAHEIVQPIDLLSVQNTLANSGIVAKQEFDSLFLIRRGDELIWRVPGTEREINVTAASNESDGMVIINQKGTFSPCPVDQLQKL